MNNYKKKRFIDYSKCFLIWLYQILVSVYIFIFARPRLQKINRLILRAALRGSGYNNFSSIKLSGEDAFIDALCKTSPKLCLDIGANKGGYSDQLLKKTNSFVFAFEPLPKAYKSLSELKEKYPNRFDCANIGLSSSDGVLALSYGDEDSELASFSQEINGINYVGCHNINQMDVQVYSLDSYYKKYLAGRFNELDLIKIDTEGYEYEVLLGAQLLIEELRPKFIQIEYNWHHLFRGHTLKMLSEILPHYDPYQLLPYGRGLIWRDASLPETNIFHYSNFVFVRNDYVLPF